MKKKVPVSFWEEQLVKEKQDNKDPEKVKFIRNVLISEYTTLYEKYLEKGDYKKTNEMNDKIHELKKDLDVSSKEEVVWLFEKKALDYLQDSYYDEAISYFKVALEKSLSISTIKPEEIKNIKESLKKAYSEKGLSNLNQNKFDEAIVSFKKILDFCVENSGKKSDETKEALNNLIMCYNLKGEYFAKRDRFEDAINTIDKAIKITNDMGIETETAKSAKGNISKIQAQFAFNQIDKEQYGNLKKSVDDISVSLSCSKCGYSVQEDWINCPKCGEPLSIKCSKCDKEIKFGWVLCPYCGHSDVRKCPACGLNLKSDWKKCPKCRKELT